MARKHGVVKVEVWEPGSGFRALNKDPQRAYILLLSQPSINNVGVLDYTPERWAMYAADDTLRALKKALRALIVSRFCVVDERTRELLVRTFIKHDRIGEQPNLVKSARKQFREVESATIRECLRSTYPWLTGQSPAPCEEGGEPPEEPLPEPLSEPLGEGVTEPLSPTRALVTPSPSPAPKEKETSKDVSPELTVMRSILSYANTTLGHKWKLTDGRKSKIRARLREGYTVDQLKAAIDGALLDPWEFRCVNNNDDPLILFRDSTHVDRFLAFHDTPTNGNGRVETDEQRTRRIQHELELLEAKGA